MNLPNKLTILRMALVPFFVFFTLADFIPHHLLIAGLIFGAILEVFAASLFHTELWSGLRSLPAVLNLPAIGLFLALSLAIWKLPKIHPIFFIAVGAACGLLFGF